MCINKYLKLKNTYLPKNNIIKDILNFNMNLVYVDLAVTYQFHLKIHVILIYFPLISFCFTKTVFQKIYDTFLQQRINLLQIL